MMAACMLVLGSAAGGTVAWLIGESRPVVNTFSYGNIAVNVTETDTNDGDNNPYTNHYHMTPGGTIIKDPTVTIAAGSEDAWLFVKMDQSAILCASARFGAETEKFDELGTLELN